LTCHTLWWVLNGNFLGQFNSAWQAEGFTNARGVRWVLLLACKLGSGNVTLRPWNTYPDTWPDFSIIFFNLLCIYFYFVIIYIIIWYGIWIFGLRVSLTPNPRPDPCVLLDLTFLLVRFDRFQFQILFFNILDFSWFSETFLN